MRPALAARADRPLLAAFPRLALLAALAVSTGACAESSDPAPAPGPLPVQQPRPAQEQSLLFDGGFESGTLRPWRVQQAATERISVVRSPTDKSRFAARFEVRPGDVVAAGAGGGNRAEVYARGPVDGSPDREGTERYYGWSTLLPSDYVLRPGFQTLVQWKSPGPGSPPVSLGLQGKALQLKVRNGPGGMSARVWRGAPLRGVWRRFVFHVKWSPDPRVGFVELWVDGQRVVSKRRMATMLTNDSGVARPVYLKQGLYRSGSIDVAQAVYHDNMRVGSRYRAVAP